MVKEKFSTLHDNKIKSLFSKINEEHGDLKNLALRDGDHAFCFKEISGTDGRSLLLWKYESSLKQVIVFANGFIGHDFFQLAYTTAELLRYWIIIKHGTLTESEQNTCKLEIERQFYFYLNGIYNIKEKFEHFVSQNGRLDTYQLQNTILTPDAQKKVLDLFAKTYPQIRQHCEARGILVHDLYNVRYDVSENCLKLWTSQFDLLTDRALDKKSKDFSFKLSELTIMQPLEAVHRLRKDFLYLIFDIQNIELTKLRDKFRIDSGEVLIHF